MCRIWTHTYWETHSHWTKMLHSIDNTEAHLFHWTCPGGFRWEDKPRLKYKLKFKETPHDVWPSPLHQSEKRTRPDGEDGGHNLHWRTNQINGVQASSQIYLTNLYESIIREYVLLAAKVWTLSNLEGARVFTKTSGFWQVPLHKDLMLSTTFIKSEGHYYFKW